MTWYMDGKIPHVLGHEVAGKVVESQDSRFPIGARVFPHHHAPCLKCDICKRGQFVHCEQWKRTRLTPGGMADYFAVAPENLSDTHRVEDLRSQDAALIEPTACVCKAIDASRFRPESQTAAVVGLGSMGLLHMLLLPDSTRGYDLNETRIRWARQLGFKAEQPSYATRADVIFVCPGNQAAFDQAMAIVNPGGCVVMFAPLAPGQSLQVRQDAYFSDVSIVYSYSCGPTDCQSALNKIREGVVKAESICSHFIELEALPEHYIRMKEGEILKPMVLWK
jgi:L-iditol 2-dehydrogenase